MNPLLDSGSHGLRPVRNPLISGALQQRRKKLLVEPDSHNRAGPSPDWRPPWSRTGQPLTFVANLSLVNPSLDLLVATRRPRRRCSPTAISCTKLVAESPPCRNVRRPDTALNETKNPPSNEPPLLLDDLRKPLDIQHKAPYHPQTNCKVEHSSPRVDLRPHLHKPAPPRGHLPDPAPPPQPPLTRHCPPHQPHSRPPGEARLDTQQIANPKK